MPTEVDLTGCYDLVYLPHDGGWYAQLIWKRACNTSPVYASREMADIWARRHGGTRRLLDSLAD